MINPALRSQVNLLLQVLPSISEEDELALKGGTAINLFVRDFPRLSVDIDLAYLPFYDRKTSLRNISDALIRIQGRLKKGIPSIQADIVHQSSGLEAKMICHLQNSQIMIEINTTIRGHLFPARFLPVSDQVQKEFGKFAAMNVVSQGELYGGKICAALDRQHPRDLFDVFHLLKHEGISEEIRQGFISCLLSSNRPISEILRPNFKDQRETFQNQFTGMTFVPFSYKDFEAAREQLIKQINTTLTEPEKEFILSFKKGYPEWSLFPIPILREMPAVRWKLLNIQKLKEQNPAKHAGQLKMLEDVLLGTD